MNEKLERLKELAEKATPGEWLRDQYPDVNSQVIARGNEVILWHRGHGRQINANVIPNMEYIAAANPETILSLIAELEAKEAEVERLTDVICKCSIKGLYEITRDTYEAHRNGKTGDA